jgi:hypothetical protein
VTRARVPVIPSHLFETSALVGLRRGERTDDQDPTQSLFAQERHEPSRKSRSARPSRLDPRAETRSKLSKLVRPPPCRHAGFVFEVSNVLDQVDRKPKVARRHSEMLT